MAGDATKLANEGDELNKLPVPVLVPMPLVADDVVSEVPSGLVRLGRAAVLVGFGRLNSELVVDGA